MNSLVELVKSLAPVITAATPVLLILVNWWVTSRQTKALKAHSDENRDKIVSGTSGTFKKLEG